MQISCHTHEDHWWAGRRGASQQHLDVEGSCASCTDARDSAGRIERQHASALGTSCCCLPQQSCGRPLGCTLTATFRQPRRRRSTSTSRLMASAWPARLLHSTEESMGPHVFVSAMQLYNMVCTGATTAAVLERAEEGWQPAAGAAGVGTRWRLPTLARTTAAFPPAPPWHTHPAHPCASRLRELGVHQDFGDGLERPLGAGGQLFHHPHHAIAAAAQLAQHAVLLLQPPRVAKVGG